MLQFTNGWCEAEHNPSSRSVQLAYEALRGSQTWPAIGFEIVIHPHADNCISVSWCRGLLRYVQAESSRRPTVVSRVAMGGIEMVGQLTCIVRPVGEEGCWMNYCR